MTITAAARPSLRQRLSSGWWPFVLRRLHSLTGILLGGYIVIHLLVTATLVEGYREGAERTVFQKQVDALHSIPFLRLTAWLLIYVPILYHTVYGLWLTYTAQPNINPYPYTKNVLYVFQRVSALVLVAFLLFHITAMRGWWGRSLAFNPSDATRTTISHLSASWFIGWFIYPVGILAACYHLANGFWTAAISWGITVSAGAQRRWGWVCVGIFIFTFLCGMTALVGALSPAATAHHG